MSHLIRAFLSPWGNVTIQIKNDRIHFLWHEKCLQTFPHSLYLRREKLKGLKSHRTYFVNKTENAPHYPGVAGLPWAKNLTLSFVNLADKKPMCHFH